MIFHRRKERTLKYLFGTASVAVPFCGADCSCSLYTGKNDIEINPVIIHLFARI